MKVSNSGIRIGQLLVVALIAVVTFFEASRAFHALTSSRSPKSTVDGDFRTPYSLHDPTIVDPIARLAFGRKPLVLIPRGFSLWRADLQCVSFDPDNNIWILGEDFVNISSKRISRFTIFQTLPVSSKSANETWGMKIVTQRSGQIGDGDRAKVDHAATAMRRVDGMDLLAVSYDLDQPSLGRILDALAARKDKEYDGSRDR